MAEGRQTGDPGRFARLVGHRPRGRPAAGSRPACAQSRILVVGRAAGTAPARDAEKVKAKFGTELVPITAEQQLAAFQAVDAAAAEAEAEQYWFSAAKKIVEPSRQDILDGARLFLGLKNLMIEHRAQAVTSTLCMHNPCNACLAFCKLNDLGLVGACEGDMDSTLTMLMFGYAFGKPGFITDPLFDVSKNCSDPRPLRGSHQNGRRGRPTASVLDPHASRR